MYNHRRRTCIITESIREKRAHKFDHVSSMPRNFSLSILQFCLKSDIQQSSLCNEPENTFFIHSLHFVSPQGETS